MSVEFWDHRYAEKEFVYGTEPNNFVRDQIIKLKPGKILFPAEGEGRNAVFAAGLGFEVTAFDASAVGQQKALDLAKSSNVEINYLLRTYETIDFEKNSFDCIVLVFAHMPASTRTIYHQKILSFLKLGGTVLLQGFSKDQIFKDTGGPKDIAMLFSEDDLKQDFSELKDLRIWQEETHLQEGNYHNGLASVINLIGRK
ncbi:MAG: class I SAM-dependent methyltransferase [Bacteroidales bacterium]|nr:class I SAM-dependent methyltransferase [Bacteroidales bacterium]